MDDKSLNSIKNIIELIENIDKLVKDKNAEYFYDSSSELTKLIDLIFKIDKCINDVSIEVKNQYPIINWSIVASMKDFDQVFGDSMNIGNAWKLADGELHNQLYDKLKTIIEKEV